MLKFTRFDCENPEHIKYANKSQEVIFINDDNEVKSGCLVADYTPYSGLVYKIYCTSDEVIVQYKNSVSNTPFIPIEID